MKDRQEESPAPFLREVQSVRSLNTSVASLHAMKYYSTMVPAGEEGVRQFKVYLPRALIKRLKYAAIEQERSLSSIVADALEAHLGALRRHPRPTTGRTRHGG